MPDRFSKVFLIVAGAVFAATGLVFVIAPELVAAIRECPGASADARNDVRAVYGAIELGLGLFLVRCGQRPTWHEAGLHAVVIVGGAAALSRFVGYALLPGTPVAHLGYGALDAAFVVLAGYGLRRHAASGPGA